ncbi:MAG: SDR family oxidoreductase, partial [Planctomycetota bacterium]|nr:SDR family oxidoreductase [Planctomycetota bacterium]
DIVVNSAAIWHPTPLDKVTDSEVQEFFRINSLAPFLIARSAGLVMAGQERGGTIINIGDWSPVRPYPDYAAYFLSKGNLPTMTRMLAVELAARNPSIRVNAVLPGPVTIPDNLPSETREAIINATLVKREGSPQNIADACLCLIENDFITGVCLPVDGGRSVYSPENPI